MKTINPFIMQVGKAVFNFDEQGKQTSAYFMPTMKVNVNTNLLQDICVGESADVIKSNAEIALASWFNQMNEIELADREQYTLKSEVETCTKYSNGKVRMCVVVFNFLKISELESSKKIL
jgi:hypothetical protein